jgi:hypothetical protein
VNVAWTWLWDVLRMFPVHCTSNWILCEENLKRKEIYCLYSPILDTVFFIRTASRPGIGLTNFLFNDYGWPPPPPPERKSAGAGASHLHLVPKLWMSAAYITCLYGLMFVYRNIFIFTFVFVSHTVKVAKITWDVLTAVSTWLWGF